MERKRHTYLPGWAWMLLCLLPLLATTVRGQDVPAMGKAEADSLVRTATATGLLPLTAVPADSIAPMGIATDSIAADSLRIVADSIAGENTRKLLELTANPDLPDVAQAPVDSVAQAIVRPQWIPNPTTATWLALVIPGGGQIYNRKYWKLPIIYGGFAGCAYALTWNGKMYKDYSNAYKDAVNNRWESTSITDLLPPGYLDQVSKSQLTETLRKRKDTYRRWRDMSIFAFIAVYLVSIIDAYVDAELSNFDITPDLSMHVEPAVINSRMDLSSSSSGRSVGVQCSFRF